MTDVDKRKLAQEICGLVLMSIDRFSEELELALECPDPKAKILAMVNCLKSEVKAIPNEVAPEQVAPLGM